MLISMVGLPLNRPTSITNSPFSVGLSYTYDPAGMNTYVAGPNNAQAAYMYDEEGHLKKSYLSDNNTAYVTYRSYDVLGRVTRIRTENQPGTVLTDYSYTYDANGNRTQEKNEKTGAYTVYAYYPGDRLKSESYYTSTGTLSRQISYEYDLLGNRTKVTDSQTGTTTYGYDKANQLTTKNSVNTYTYDAMGNLVGDGTYTYVYNVQNQLTQVKQGTTVIVQYEYNADGLRTKKIANGKTEMYYYNGTHLVYITDQTNKVRFFFTRDVAGRLLNMIDYTGVTPTTYWYVYDEHGNVVGLGDRTGALVVTYSYDAWGNQTSSSGTATAGDGQLLVNVNPFRYAGYQFDGETGLYYLKSRYYSPTLGRFLTRDIVPDNNLYAYCSNNPINSVDPTGLYDEGRGDAGAYDSSHDMVNGTTNSERWEARGIYDVELYPQNPTYSPAATAPSSVSSAKAVGSQFYSEMKKA